MAKKILVVDDDPEMVKMVCERLTSNGYEVSTAYDGETGLQKVDRERPDLIILDIKMPAMDGFTFVRKLRAKESEKSLPVIILTGRDKMDDLFAQEGITDYVVKPYDPADLLERIRRGMDKARSRLHP